MHNEAHEAAVAAILRPAGFGPHPFWGTYTRDTFVVAVTPDDQTLHVKDWAAVMPGHPLYGPDTPDTPEEAAQWLVALWQRQQEALTQTRSADEIRLEQNLEGQDDGPTAKAASDFVDSGSGGNSGGDDGSAEAGADGRGLALYDGDGPTRADIGDGDSVYDADYDEIGSELDDLARLALPQPGENVELRPQYAHGPVDPALLEGPPIEDFDPDPPKPSGPGAFIFGDNLDQMRISAIGQVTQIALRLKEKLQEGWTLDEYRMLQNLIMRIDRGEAPNNPLAKARFAAISDCSRAMSAIDAHAEAQVKWLNKAGRQEVAAYDPEAGWP